LLAVAVSATAPTATTVAAAAPAFTAASTAVPATTGTVAPTSALPSAGTASISGHFTLETLDGREVSDATYRGKWLLVYFGYTYCPDVCPTVLIRIGQALNELGALAEQIQPIFITVDPDRDTANHLTQYMTAFNAHIIGLRGDSDHIRAAAQQFHAYYGTRSLGNGEYTADHSSYLYVIAPDGHFRRLLADSLPADQLADTLRTLAAKAQ
jgi:protein SCO1/2